MDNGISNKIYQDIATEINTAKRWIAITEANLMRKKLSLTYDKLVDMFYSKKTKVYRRHGINKAGTRTGKNLYRALQSGSYKYHRPFIEQYTIDGGIQFSPKDMQSYRYNDDKEYVLEKILNGYRFVTPRVSGFLMMYSLEYSDSDTGKSYLGSILEVLNSLRDDLVDVYDEKAKELAKTSLKLKYVELI